MGAAAGPIALAMAVVGQVKQGVDANNAARAAARVDDENARLTVLQGEQEALATRRDERMASGDMIAAFAGSGLSLGGSFSDLLAENAYQRELEILNIRTTRAREGQNLQNQATQKRKAGRSALINGMIGAVSTALSGADKMRQDNQVRQQVWDERNVILGGGRVPPVRVTG